VKKKKKKSDKKQRKSSSPARPVPPKLTGERAKGAKALLNYINDADEYEKEHDDESNDAVENAWDALETFYKDCTGSGLNTEDDDKDVEESKKDGEKEEKPLNQTTTPSSEDLQNAVNTLTSGFGDYNSFMSLDSEHLESLKSSLAIIDRRVRENINSRDRLNEIAGYARRRLIEELDHNVKLARSEIKSLKSQIQPLVDSAKGGTKEDKEMAQKKIQDVRTKMIVQQETIKDTDVFTNAIVNTKFDGYYKTYEENYELVDEIYIRVKIRDCQLVYSIKNKAVCHIMVIGRNSEDGAEQLVEKDDNGDFDYITDHYINISFPDSKEESLCYDLPNYQEDDEAVLEYRVDGDDVKGPKIVTSHLTLIGITQRDVFIDFIGRFIKACYSGLDVTIPLSEYKDPALQERLLGEIEFV